MRMFVHDISRVAFEAGPLVLRWYSLMFALGVVLYYVLTQWMWKREIRLQGARLPGQGWSMDDFDWLVVFLFFGLVIGARLGEVLFYHPEYYLSHPVEIFKIWKGGLASHGATIGLFLAYVLFWGLKRLRGRRRGGARFAFGKYTDGLAVGMPLVAGFVRIGNFFNSEIVGREVGAGFGSNFGVVFAQNGEAIARHPVQIYEGLLLWAIFALLLWLWVKKRARGGVIVFLFIGLYFLGRFGLEFFKEYQVLEAGGGWAMGLTMGQVLSVVPVLLAVGYFAFVYPKQFRS